MKILCSLLIILVLLTCGCSAYKNYNLSELHDAAQNGDAGKIYNMLSIDKRNIDNYTALEVAIMSQKPESVKILLEFNADVNLRNDYYGTTPLLLACMYSCAEIVEILLNNNVDINQKNISGWTSVMSAAGHGSVEVLELLIINNADIDAERGGWTPLFLAVSRGYHDKVKVLVEAGADVNYINEYGETARSINYKYNYENIKLYTDIDNLLKDK